MTRNYFLIDCKEFPLGRAASRIAFLLAGKHKPDYSRNVDGGDFVVAINSDHMEITGGKKEKKKYHKFSGYPGGISTRNLNTAIAKDSKRVVSDAVYGMLPKNNLRKKMLKRLLVFKDEKHRLNSKFIIIKK